MSSPSKTPSKPAAAADTSSSSSSSVVEEDKYDKARRQSQKDMLLIVLLIVILIMGGVLLTHNPKPKVIIVQKRDDANKGLLLRGANNSPLAAQLQTSKQSGSSGSSSVVGAAADASSDAANQNAAISDQNTAGHETEEDEDSLIKLVEEWDKKVRDIKSKVPIFETDPAAQDAAKHLQDATRRLLHFRYGPLEPYRVQVNLEYQNTIPEFRTKGKYGQFVIELAPSRLQPHSIYTFLEMARAWKGGAFHRIADHVLQVLVRSRTIPHLAFQEYSPEYPHVAKSVGYAGRPSGPAWYVSTIDNTQNHGPGSQQKRNPYEADSCFGKVVEGWEHVERIKTVPGKGFISDAKKHVLIKYTKIMIPDGQGGYKLWEED